MPSVTEGWGRLTWGQAGWNDAQTIEQGWGRETWGYQAWGDTPIVTLTGLTATTTLGVPEELIEVKPGWGTLNWGENGWGSVESATETLTGLSATTTLGTVTPADVVGLTGLSATSTLNSLSLVKSDLTFTLTGLGLVSSEGLISLDDHSVGLSGLSATSVVGSLAPADIMGITGQSAATSLGTLSFTSNPLITLNALTVLAAELGGITALPNTLVDPAGQSATTAIGTTTTTQLSNVFPEGQVATSSVNNDKLILRYYGKLDPKVSTGYTTKTSKTSVSGYAVKTPKTSTGYTAINPE